MTTYFADTSYWVALIDRRDQHHSKATELSQHISGSIVTTEAVLLETANSFSRPSWRLKAIALINHLLGRNDIVVDKGDWLAGWRLFTARADKAWSLTDCISFELMRSRGLTEALSADTHFNQAGFNALLLAQ